MAKQKSETFVIQNADGSISLDPYADKSREELKIRCGQLCRAVQDWQIIALSLAEHGRGALSLSQTKELDDLIEAYRD